MTIIYAATVNNELVATIIPKISRNNVNTVRLHVDFDSAWSAYGARSAVFTTSKSARPYEKTLSADGDCLVPPEVLAEECQLKIYVKGVNANDTKTSTKLAVKVLDGTPTVIIGDPTPSVYQQLLNAYEVQRARINNLAKLTDGSTTGDAELTDVRVGASAQFTAFSKLLEMSTPQYVVWALGMNNPDNGAINADWLTCVEAVIAACESRGITPILATIPNVPERDHTYKNSWVKSSGHRYVDFEKAVGANETGAWLGGMLSGDKVHPTELGAKALASRFIVDVPEIAQKK